MAADEVEGPEPGTCPHCGTPGSEGEDVCQECGGTLATRICPSCMTENLPFAHACQACNRPLDSIAFNDPMRFIYALGWVLQELSRKADVGRINALLALGAVIAFGPWVVYLVALFYHVATGMLLWHITPLELLSLGVWSVFPVCYSVLLFKVLRARQQRDEERIDDPDVAEAADAGRNQGTEDTIQ